ncbi:MAG: ATP-binding protein [Comamonadaceae bacterium]|nr:MAG: ATP-binding protein [Comamonadaceae bacterium]
MFLLLQNLLGNAWKFTAAHPEARIRVEAEQAGEGLVVRVADNGIARLEADAGRIFELFTRLQGPQAYEGTPGQGATFSFRL